MTVHWVGLVSLGAIVQAAIIGAMRQYGMGFWGLLPLSILMQWLFMTAYASKSTSFTVVWFTATGITAIVSLCLGSLLFKDQVSVIQWLGVILTLIGVALTQIS